MGPAKLWPMEQACIRDAADTLLFCADLKRDPAAREALSAVAILSDDLIHADRWTPERTQRLIDDIWACGPEEALEVPVAA
jgi:hypothetical protein